MRVPALHSERLVIRELVVDDFDALRPLDVDTAWLKWTVLSYVELAKLHQPPYGDRAIELKPTNEVVGLCGYAPLLGPYGQIPGLGNGRPARHTAEVGLYWNVLPSHRRHGYATEAGRALIEYAFSTLELQRILATTTYDNTASIGVMRKLGMRIEHNPLPDPPWLQVVGVLA
jgi:ribosomal-protein-alanine N-acetyltransferase